MWLKLRIPRWRLTSAFAAYFRGSGRYQTRLIFLFSALTAPFRGDSVICRAADKLRFDLELSAALRAGITRRSTDITDC